MTLSVTADPSWKTAASGAAITDNAFNVSVGDFVVVESVTDSGTGTISCAWTTSTGVTPVKVAADKVGASGGAVSVATFYVSSAATGMTATATWSGTGTTGGKAIKHTIISGAPSSSQIGAVVSGTSSTNNISPSYTNTIDQSLGFGVAIEWNADGLPTSTDTEVAFHLAGTIDGISVYKAAVTSGTGQTVTLNMDAGGTAAAAWAYIIFEILPSATGGSANANPATAAFSVVGMVPTPQLASNPGTAAFTGVAGVPTPQVEVSAVVAAFSGVAMQPSPQTTVAPASAVFSAVSTTPVPQQITVNANVATAAFTVVATVPTPQVAVTTAIAAFTGVAEVPTPQLGATPAAATFSVVATIPTPQVAFAPATATFSVGLLQPAGSQISINLASASAAFVGQANTVRAQPILMPAGASFAVVATSPVPGQFPVSFVPAVAAFSGGSVAPGTISAFAGYWGVRMGVS